MATGNDMSDIYKSRSLNVKRTRFLSHIPAEHQNFFTSSERFTIHNAGCISAKKTKDYNKIEFLPEEPITIHVGYYDGQEPLNKYTRACIHAYALMPLYDTYWNTATNPTLAHTLGTTITILGTYAPYSAMVDSGLEKELARCHMVVRKQVWNTHEEVRVDTEDIRKELAIQMKVGDFDASPQTCTIVALSTLILIGKNVTENNRDGWFRNRWRALANVVNVLMNYDRIEPPLLRPCQSLYSSASANQPIRSCLFRIMRSLASVKDNQSHIIFDRLINLLQWAEMSHIWMIIEYIYDQNPDILNFPELSGPEIAAMSVAIDFLRTHPKEDRAYLKLLCDHNDLKPLHSINFIYFTAAAHAISSLTRTSMLNINARFSETVKAFQDKVITYMHAKGSIGPLSAAESYTSTSTSHIRNALTKALEFPQTIQDIPDFIDHQPEARE